MKESRDETKQFKTRHKAILIKGPKGFEVRSPLSRHLLGVFIAPGQLEIKCGPDEYVVVEVPKAV